MSRSERTERIRAWRRYQEVLSERPLQTNAETWYQEWSNALTDAERHNLAIIEDPLAQDDFLDAASHFDKFWAEFTHAYMIHEESHGRPYTLKLLGNIFINWIHVKALKTGGARKRANMAMAAEAVDDDEDGALEPARKRSRARKGAPMPTLAKKYECACTLPYHFHRHKPESCNYVHLALTGQAWNPRVRSKRLSDEAIQATREELKDPKWKELRKRVLSLRQ